MMGWLAGIAKPPFYSHKWENVHELNGAYLAMRNCGQNAVVELGGTITLSQWWHREAKASGFNADDFTP